MEKEAQCHGCRPIDKDLVGVHLITNVWLNVVKAFLACISNQVHNVSFPQLRDERLSIQLGFTIEGNNYFEPIELIKELALIDLNISMDVVKETYGGDIRMPTNMAQLGKKKMMEKWVIMVVEAHVDRYITLNFMTSICCNSKVKVLMEHFRKGEWNKYNNGIIAKMSTLLCLLGKIGDGMGFHVDWSQASNIGFALHKSGTQECH